MAQIFHHSANATARMSIVIVVCLVGFVAWAGYTMDRGAYETRQNEARDQPVPFSHAHHVGALGIDCRYCHTSVEESSFANIPPTKTCINCHSQIWNTSPTLEPVRASYRTGDSISWTRVHDLPDFVYFNHSIHVNKGVGCESCHGRVDKMPLMWKANTLEMSWCLDCHRNPQKVLRPRSEITTMGYVAAGDQEEIGRQLMHDYNTPDVRVLTSCSTCHR
jgi:Cytochrome c7 and related cytochrome c